MSGRRTKILLVLLFCFPLWYSITGAVVSSLQNPGQDPGGSGYSTSDTLRILHADVIRYDRDFSEARRLIGNVVINHDSVTMYCDSAWHFEAQGRIEAFGNVQIVRDFSDEKIFGDYLIYNKNEKLAQIWDNVRALNTDAVLTTQTAFYNIEDEVIYYDSPGRIVYKDSSILTSRRGRYFTRDRYAWFNNNVRLNDPQYDYRGDTLVYNQELERVEFYGPSTIYFHQDNGSEDTLMANEGWIYTPDSTGFFYDNVKLYDPDFYIEADTLRYSKLNADGFAKGNIMIVSPSDSIAAYGDYSTFSRNPDVVMLTDRPVIKYWEGNDTLYMKADTLWAFTRQVEDSTFRQVLGNRNIRYYREDLQGRCDSLFFSTQDSILRMFGQNLMWSDLHQVSSDSAYLHLLNRKPSVMNLYGAPFIASSEDTMDYFNQIKGVQIDVFFDDSSHLEHVEVLEDANAIYYVKDGDDYIGGNKVASRNMYIYVVDNKAESILFTPNSNGVLSPIEDILPEKFNFVEFNWQDALRPKDRTDILQDNPGSARVAVRPRINRRRN